MAIHLTPKPYLTSDSIWHILLRERVCFSIDSTTCALLGMHKEVPTCKCGENAICYTCGCGKGASPCQCDRG